ncbi:MULTISPECIES: hypothetical protein [unclassified Streptomyces]|uniref:hypothetical protein n=1 Tax=unclassified Streptomyces TaxID=2593676 RepID=UPI00344E8247
MKRTVVRLLKPVLRFLHLAQHPRPPRDTYAYVHPYSCAYVGGPTVHRTGERPPRGEDSPLVRPYFVAYERQVAEALAAERRRQRMRGGRLWVAVRGVDLPARSGGGTGIVA